MKRIVSSSESCAVSVSLLLISYQQKKYIEEALQSTLSQDYSGLQVVVSDDASTDGTWEIIQKIAASYKGQHQVIIRRNESNRGMAANFNEGLKCCSGELIVVQAGDDISESYRVSSLVKLWVNNRKEPDMLYSNVTWINEDGSLIKVDQKNPVIPSVDEIKRGSFFIAGGMAAAYSRRLFSKFGYLSEVVRTEDYVLTFRAIISGGLAFEPAALVKYRQHPQSEMAKRQNLSYDYQITRMYSAAKVAEAEDRFRSWKISQHNGCLYKMKLRMALFSVRIHHQSLTGTFWQRIGCAFLALFSLRLKFFFSILKRDVTRMLKGENKSPE